MEGVSIAQTPPGQPGSGPGGNTYPHGSMLFTKFGSNINDCYWIAEPNDPKPDSAVVVVFWHGTTSVMAIDSVPYGQYLFIEHIAKKGYTVIFPLYQYGGNTLPFQQQIINAASVVNMALTKLVSGAGRVRPKYRNGNILLGATGISRGGGMTLNVATYHDTLNLPSFQALCAFVPGAGQSMQGIDSSAKVLVVNGEDNTLNFAESQLAFDSLFHIPCANKHLIVVNTDTYGDPDLIAEHNFSGSGNNPLDNTRVNTLDYYGSWKYAVGIFDCAFKNQNCEYCFGSDTLIMYMGHWSDGTPVNPATIIDTCGNIPSATYKTTDDGEWFRFYPNPSRGMVNIVLNDQNRNFNITIFDLLGVKQLETKDQNQINISGLPNGIYFIRVEMNDWVSVKKIILDR